MQIKITPNDKGSPAGKLADAELHFTDGPLAGLKLIGFAVWERRSGNGRNVTMPARIYSVSGERRSYALLRPIARVEDQEHLRDLILSAYAAYEAEIGRAALQTARTHPEPTPAPPVAAQAEPTPAAGLSSEEAAALAARIAADLWPTLTSNERTMIAFGVFPHDKMTRAVGELPHADAHRLIALALMDERKRHAPRPDEPTPTKIAQQYAESEATIHRTAPPAPPAPPAPKQPAEPTQEPIRW